MPKVTKRTPRPIRISLEAFKDAFSSISDPRINRTKRYSLFDIIGLTLIANICGAETWASIEKFGHAKKEWLRKFINLDSGVPSHDTISRVFSLINPNEFTRALVGWLSSISPDGKLVNIDGKSLKGSRSNAQGLKPLHIVTAWLSDVGISIGHIACQEKSNEITAIPDLLELIDINGKIITIDAMGCQKKIAEQIKNGNGDYILGLKGNQGTLHESVKLSFEGATPKALTSRADDSTKYSVEKDHGRVEERTVYVFNDASQWPETSEWLGLESIIVVDRKRTILVTGTVSHERQYYISSLKSPSAKSVAEAIRKHWGVEAGLHWHLDVSFGEDACQIVDRNAAQNLSSIRKAALTLLERTKAGFKCGVKTLRNIAGWDTAAAERVLAHASVDPSSLI